MKMLNNITSGIMTGLFTILTGFSSASFAGSLNLADNALEVISAVEPNIMILADDSGSMDWGMMTTEALGVYHLDGVEYYYTHPAPGATGSSPAINIDGWKYVGNPDVYGWVLPTEEHLKAEGLADPQAGVWRAWNHNYNKLYYNPNITYRPWLGVDINGNAFTDITPTAAPYDPYQPATGTLNLTADSLYKTDCGLIACIGIPGLSGLFTVNNFYPARYYEWADANSTTPANAGNGLVDSDDDHTLVEILSTTTSYSRAAYDSATGVGRRDCTDNLDGTATCTYAQEIQNFANWFSYFRKRDLVAKSSFSRVIEPVTSARIGYATTNNPAANNIPVGSMNVSAASGAKKTLLDGLFSTSPSGDTFLRSSLEKTGKYYECVSGDIFGSAAASAPGAAGCPILAAPAGTCQANYTLLMTDGFWNGTDPTFGADIDGDASSDFDGGAFADTFSNTLADVAMHFYERDLQGTLTDDVPTTARDINGYSGVTTPFERMHQHMKTYTIGFGVNGTLSADPPDTTTAFPWTNPLLGDAQKIDDVRHAAFNGRGMFLSSGDPEKLNTAVSDIFEDIKANTGTATAVAFNTQEVEAGTMVFRASFNTKTDSGDLVAQRVNPDGTIQSTIEWSAAAQLDTVTSANSDSRVVVTYKDTGAATSEGIPFSWADLTSGVGSQQALLDSPQPTSIPALTNTFGDERLEYLRGQHQYEGTSFANGQFRERPSTAGKLGDIVHSTPVFVGKPNFIGRDLGIFPQATTDLYSKFVTDRKSRTELVYTGANDGMLHAIRVSDGKEHFAYIPNIVINNLSKLTDPDYVHRFYVDLTPSINDVFITPAKGTNAGTASWNSVLVGGLGAGGKGYFALNVTDPDDLDTEAEAKLNVLWEFTEADDGSVGNSDLGYTFSQPLIAMSNAVAGGEQRWVAIFGNGYNSTSTDGDAHLYVAFIEGGQDGVWTLGTDYIKINTSYGKAESSDGATPNGISGIRGIDSDKNGTVDYIYAGDLQGNMYRFDLTSATPGSWATTPKILFKARYKAASAFPRDIPQPITTRPIVVSHPTDSGYIVIFSTGSWITTGDATSNDIQSIYGVWDDMSISPEVTMLSTTNQMVEQSFTNHASQEHGFTVRTSTNNAVVWKNTGSSGTKVKGWYIDLDIPPAGSAVGVEYPGERAVRNLQLRGGILFVNTVIPRSTSACSTGAGGYELAMNPLTGGVPEKVTFDLNNDGTFDYYDNVADVNDLANVVTGMRFDSDTPTDSAFIGSRRMTQAGDEIRSIDTNTGTSFNTGRTSWREIGP